jgi:hypothetical protein
MSALSAAPASKARGAFLAETVTFVQHWTDSLFSFRTTRERTACSRSAPRAILACASRRGSS